MYTIYDFLQCRAYCKKSYIVYTCSKNLFLFVFLYLHTVINGYIILYCNPVHTDWYNTSIYNRNIIVQYNTHYSSHYLIMIFLIILFFKFMFLASLINVYSICVPRKDGKLATFFKAPVGSIGNPRPVIKFLLFGPIRLGYKSSAFFGQYCIKVKRTITL